MSLPTETTYSTLFYAALKQRAHPFPVPSAPLDPQTASDGELDMYGIPRRPDPAAGSDLSAFWSELAGAPFKLVTPEFPQPPAMPKSVAPYIIRTLRFTQGEDPASFSRFNHRERSRNWSGGYITPVRPNRFKMMIGGWTVPKPAVPTVLPAGAGPGTIYRSSTWIGFDGHRSRYPNASLPQIGTSQYVSLVNGLPVITYGAWWQWWKYQPDPNAPENVPVPILNMPVAAEDRMLAGMIITAPNDVHFFLKNLRSGHFCAFKVMPPGAIHPLGTTAEWIMERPTHPVTGLDLMPHCDDVTFRYCIAQSAPTAGPWTTQTFRDGVRCIDMVEAFASPHRSAIVSRATKLTATSLRVRYREAGDPSNW